MTEEKTFNPYSSLFFVFPFLLFFCCFFYPWFYEKVLKPFFQKRARRNHLKRRERAASDSARGRSSSENGYELQVLDRGEPSNSMCLDDNATTNNEMVNKYVEMTNKYMEMANKYDDDDDIDLAAPFHVLRRSKSLNDIDTVMYRY
ncbi:hypothetical protein AVEN_213350-1 [Araneus ventricosus]|uniref:Uncharacterized protein n=1 Tax=Araneus ventricosus TaxID=182803 RepID=A0A4Y2JAK6_ARAVE|nr:hypothetical protein AVEN_213350-1 [Araneus ventricosus]